MLNWCTVSRRIMPYYDQRLPLRPEQPELEFAVQQQEITDTEQWHQVRLVLLAGRRAWFTSGHTVWSEQRCCMPCFKAYKPKFSFELRSWLPHKDGRGVDGVPQGTATDKHAVCVLYWLPVQVLADQPFTASRRRQLLLNFLQAKLEAEDEQLLLEGARVRTVKQRRQLGAPETWPSKQPCTQ